MDIFDYKITLNNLLSSNDNIFDRLIQAIEDYYVRPLSTLKSIKSRDSKISKGRTWEIICRDWLLATGKATHAWLLQDVPEDILQHLRLLDGKGHISKIDNGIDIISYDGEYHAIQCKYRSKKARITWTQLSTFIGLCSITGPYKSHIVMTNCSSVTRKVIRTPKDKSICIGSFRNTKREEWLKMCDNYTEHRVEGKKATSIEEMRNLRLLRFASTS